MALLQSNATIGVQRRTYNAGTKQTSAPAAVVGLEAVPVYVQGIGHTLRAQGMAPEFSLKMLWDDSIDIRDGDVITGYNPSGSAHPALLQVQHTDQSGGGTPISCKVAFLKALEPAGYST